MSKRTVILDQDKPFSQSLFWQGQRQFYQVKGINAWADTVPFYITSNPFIADCYANLILRFLQDWIQQHPDSINHPFYIAELGAGSGQFSFYILKNLQEKLQHFNRSEIKLHYIMTDFAENNIQAWEQHEKLQPFLQQKTLDFAQFDLEKDSAIHTIHHSFSLTPNSVHNPLIVIANYVFDSVISDIYKIKDKQIYSSLVSLSTNDNNIKNGLPKNWRQVKIKHTDRLSHPRPYSDDTLNKTLSIYSKTLTDSYILFPIGALNGLQRLRKMANDKLFLISSDKGFTNSLDLDELDYPEIDFHGSFSLMVNYHALANYFKISQGDFFLQTPRDGIVTGVFSSLGSLADFKELHYALQNHVQGFSPADFYNIAIEFDDLYPKADLKFVASLLTLSCWDPYLFMIVSERLIKLIIKEDNEVINHIIQSIPKLVDNFFYLPKCDDIFFPLGLLFYELDHFAEAIKYYKLSANYFSESYELLYNLSLSYFYNKDYALAEETLIKASALNPRNATIKKLIQTCRRKKIKAKVRR